MLQANTRCLFLACTKGRIMFGLGTTEALIVLAIIVLMFGGRKLPELGRSMGKAITNFKQGMKDEDKDKDKSKSEPPEDNS